MQFVRLSGFCWGLGRSEFQAVPLGLALARTWEKIRTVAVISAKWQVRRFTAVNLFRLLRDDGLASRPIRQLRLTPFAQDEFECAHELEEPAGDAGEMARRLIIRSSMGFGSNAHNGRSTGFRANTSRSGTTPAAD
jgi:hypothetical protein